MSWKSATRRKGENLLGDYDDEMIGAANLAGELEELTGLYFSPDAVAAYVREVQAVADELIGGLPGFRLDDVESARVALIGVRATPDESKAATMVARLIAAREIERGLLG